MKCVSLPVIVRKTPDSVGEGMEPQTAGGTYLGRGQSYHTTLGCHPRSTYLGTNTNSLCRFLTITTPCKSIIQTVLLLFQFQGELGPQIDYI